MKTKQIAAIMLVGASVLGLNASFAQTPPPAETREGIREEIRENRQETREVNSDNREEMREENKELREELHKTPR